MKGLINPVVKIDHLSSLLGMYEGGCFELVLSANYASNNGFKGLGNQAKRGVREMKYAANIHYGHVVCVSRTPYLNLDHTFVYIFVVFGKHI